MTENDRNIINNVLVVQDKDCEVEILFNGQLDISMYACDEGRFWHTYSLEDTEKIRVALNKAHNQGNAA